MRETKKIGTWVEYVRVRSHSVTNKQMKRWSEQIYDGREKSAFISQILGTISGIPIPETGFCLGRESEFSTLTLGC